MTFLERLFPILANRLKQAGGAEASIKGSDEFKYEWRSLSRNKDFLAAQDAYIDVTFYGPLVEKVNLALRSKPGAGPTFDISARSTALKAVLWSIAVQNGREARIVIRAFDGLDVTTATDEIIIKAIYQERSRTDRYYPNEGDAIKRLLQARYVFEQQVALKMLAAQTAEP